MNILTARKNKVYNDFEEIKGLLLKKRGDIMKKLKYFLYTMVIIIFLPQLLMLAKPISYWYYTHNATEIGIYYSNNLLSYGDYDFDDVSENSEYISFGKGSGDLYSMEVRLKLPNQTDFVTIDATADKGAYIYNIESCFKDGDNYCALLRFCPMYNPINSKTHRGDKLVIIDKNGEIKFTLETTADEWVLDCADNNALIYNISENSFYYKNVESGVAGGKITNEFKKFKKVAFNKEDGVWTAYYKIDDEIVSYIVEL